MNWNGYSLTGEIIYEILNGNGHLKGYNDDGVLKFEGQFLNRERNGEGKVYGYDSEFGI